MDHTRLHLVVGAAAGNTGAGAIDGWRAPGLGGIAKPCWARSASAPSCRRPSPRQVDDPAGLPQDSACGAFAPTGRNSRWAAGLSVCPAHRRLLPADRAGPGARSAQWIVTRRAETRFGPHRRGLPSTATSRWPQTWLREGERQRTRIEPGPARDPRAAGRIVPPSGTIRAGRPDAPRIRPRSHSTDSTLGNV